MPSTEGKLTLVDVARVPYPGRNSMSRRTTKFTPDGKMIFLHSPEGSVHRQLAVIDLEASCAGLGSDPVIMSLPQSPNGTNGGEEPPREETLEEQMRRERLRDLGEGISGFCIARGTGQILTQQGTRLWVADYAGAPLRLALDCPLGVPSDLRLSNDGRTLSCILNGEIYMMNLGDPASLQRLTQPSEDSEPQSSRGVADFVAQEEFDRLEGYWWSPDGTLIAFQEVTEGGVPPFRILHQGSDVVREEEHRYPFAGKENPKWRIGVAELTGGRVTWLQGPHGAFKGGAAGEDCKGEYLANVTWMPDSSGVLVSLLSRSQKELSVHAFGTSGQHYGRIHYESSPTWINLNKMFLPFEGMSVTCMEQKAVQSSRVTSTTSRQCKEGFVMGSDRSGFCHLFYHHSDGTLSHPITAGNYTVLSLEGVVTETQVPAVYFTSTLETDPTQSHLFWAPLFGDLKGGAGPRCQVTRDHGTHSTLVNLSRGFFVDIRSNTCTPAVVNLNALSDGSLVSQLSPALSQQELSRTQMLKPPEITTVAARDGTVLYAALFRPDPREFGPGPYPTVVSMYGGPHVQLVQNNWSLTTSMREQFYRQRGFLVVKIDGRGSANRGVAFESEIHLNMGEVEIRDQVDGLKWLVKSGLAQEDKVVAMGWSYGGYMTARCLMHPESRGMFAAAVAGAPVTHWDGYDTGYTERYMGTPESNPDGYARSSLFEHVDEMKGSLLLVHGLLDENVHFRHTARLINRLIAARKRYQLLMFPDERHMPRHERDRIYMEEAVLEFVAEKLGLASILDADG